MPVEKKIMLCEKNDQKSSHAYYSESLVTSEKYYNFYREWYFLRSEKKSIRKFINILTQDLIKLQLQKRNNFFDLNLLIIPTK